MMDHDATVLALRTRVRGVTAATTGTTTISATATGYTRASGSFLTDGFRVGMEVVASGFATSGNTGYKVITAVSALSMTVTSATTMAVEAGGGDELLLAGCPETRLWENTKPIRSGAQIVAPTAGRPYITDEFVPATHEARTFPAQTGRVEETGLYLVTYFGLANSGDSNLRKVAQAIAALFTPGTTLAVGSNTLRIGVRTGQRMQGARLGQITAIANGWAYVQVIVPWYSDTVNLVAA